MEQSIPKIDSKFKTYVKTKKKIVTNSKNNNTTTQGRLNASDKVVIIDDLLATGGTAAAAAGLVIMCGAKIEEISFLVELDFLGGVRKLPQGIKHYSMIHLE